MHKKSTLELCQFVLQLEKKTFDYGRLIDDTSRGPWSNATKM